LSPETDSYTIPHRPSSRMSLATNCDQPLQIKSSDYICTNAVGVAARYGGIQ